LDACGPVDVACLQSVVANLDARAAEAPDKATSAERRIWESLAHAVECIAESLAEESHSEVDRSDGVLDEALGAAARATLARESDALLDRMQQPDVREGTMRGIRATPAEMSDAAHRAARRVED
jgi:hypothetical protein